MDKTNSAGCTVAIHAGVDVFQYFGLGRTTVRSTSCNPSLWRIGQGGYYDASDTSTVDATFATMWTGSDSLRRDLLGWQTVAVFYGLHNVSYESGPGSLAAGTGAYAIRDQRMIPSIEHNYLDDWFAVGGDITNYYGLRGAVSEFGDWMLWKITSTLRQPTYEAAKAVLQSPPPAIAAGYILPYAPGQTVSIDPSQRTPDIFSKEAPPGTGLTIHRDRRCISHARGCGRNLQP